ncbi:MAG: MFS transporter [Armatimonadetes bacterium]|nr:MFS transporter [Armatimonadota bacterium]
MSRSQAVSLAGGILAAGGVFLGIYFGSGQFSRFDAPLAPYAAATVLAAFGFAYRYLMWIQRPPTWKYFVASWRLFFRPRFLIGNFFKLIKLTFHNIVLQLFIARRGRNRWIGHMCLAWGCLLAFAVTFPLSWGWVQFSPAGSDYAVEFMGMRQFVFDPHSALGFVMFNALNFSAVFVLIGVGFAMHRRMFEHGAQAVQTLYNDMLPLFLLFAVAVSGLMLTASYKLMGGSHFSFLSLLHAFTVVLILLYMPFGKLFHIAQRPAQLGVQFYKMEGSVGPQAICERSGQAYQSQLHHDDLVDVMQEIGFDFGSHQNLSPQEKRKLIAINQANLFEGQPFVG